jgi:16S rRNA (adenine1518-N6/adenine1519-N6)-dimethyltransferase
MEATRASAMLAKYGLAASKRRGQNFLIDGNVARKVVAAVRAGTDDVVVEVGPGFGAITFGLAAAAGRVVAVEIDAGIVRAFRQEYGAVERVTLVNADFLEFDFAGAAGERASSGLIVAGNLPYNVTSPVIRRLIEHKAVVSRAVLMVQAEVGARIAAGPGVTDYSALSAVVQYHAAVRSLFAVRRTCFYPRPLVDSRVVEIDFRAAAARRSDPEAYADVVHAAFQKRRKMLRQSIAGLAEQAGLTTDELAASTGLDLARRGETLGIDEFDGLAVALSRGRG